MKSILVKRVLSIVLTIVLFTGNVMPVMAEGTVSGNNVSREVIDETAEITEETSPVSEVSGEEAFSEESTEQVTEGAQSEENATVESGDEETTEETTEASTEETTEVATEEVTEELETETEEAEDELSVSVNEIIDEEVPLAAPLPISLEPVTVNGITITVSGPAAAFAEGTTVSATEVEPAEVVIEAAEESEQAEVKRYKAFDINLVCNGEIVQPLNGEEITVNFEGDLLILDTDSEEEVVVYHVDDNDEITKMSAEVTPMVIEGEAEVETVEMTTTHFSTYVIMVTGEGEPVQVTINHYLSDGTRLFVSREKEVERGGSIKEFVKGVNDFKISRITIDGTEYKPSVEGNLEYKVDTKESTLVIDVYYEALSKDDEAVPVTMIDYDDTVEYGNTRGSVYNPDSINYYKNYESYEPIQNFEEARQFAYEDGWGEWFRWEDYLRLYDEYDARKDQKNWNKRFATKGAYMNYVLEEQNTDGQIVNVNDYNDDKTQQIIKGLLVNLTGENYQDVNFKYEDPGFFTIEENPYGTKEIFDNYSLGFIRNGLEYTLKDVRKDSNIVWTDLKRFFPLSNSQYGEINEYFGMRYDFTFKIGDYVGDMTYTFSGDDDLWVCLDGEVILDLGGIHQRAEGSVDVWEKLIGKANPSYEDKVAYLFGVNGDNPASANAVHTISVIYMERGGSDSNCEMHFVMPNIIPSDLVTSTAPKADVELVKKDSTTNEAIEGVGFTLYSDAACQIIKGHEQRTDENGKVSFKDLREGTYYLKETAYDTTKYQENETVYIVKVTVNGDKAIATIQNLTEKEGSAYVVYNIPIKPINLTFYKVDKYTENAIEGVTFNLKKENANGEIVKTAVSGKDGCLVFEDIREGIYYLEETETPDGYMTLTEGFAIEVISAEDGTLSYEITDGPEGMWVNAAQPTDKNLIMNTPALGPLTITKTVDKVDAEHGIAAFMFKIDCPDGSILYRTISFAGAGTKSITIKDLPLGTYTVTELSTLRYEQESVVPSNTIEMNTTDGASVSFTNKKTFEKLYSHSDVVINKVTFNKDANGNITSANISQEQISTDDVVIE